MKLNRPNSCMGCPLHTAGAEGWIPYDAFSASQEPRLALIGDFPGSEDVQAGKAFLGAPGAFQDRLLQRVRINRSEIAFGNVLSCLPPGHKLEKTPYEIQAINHCSPNLDKILNNPKIEVIIAAGNTAIRRILGLPRGKAINVENFHGVPIRIDTGQIVVCTFHPSQIMRGFTNLTGVYAYDLSVAARVLKEGYSRDQVSLVLDPPIEWFDQWVENVLSDPDYWVSIDIETLDKSRKAEDELTSADNSTQILRINFSCNPDEGITVPYSGPYITIIDRLLRGRNAKIFWNHTYDVKRLEYNQHQVSQPIYDAMDGWHVVQSDVPKGLGFVAGFYSNLGPWKHLSDSEPAYYGAMDGIQTQRIMLGVAKTLHDSGMWDIFYRYSHLLDQYCLRPAENIGLLGNRDHLQEFQERLAKRLLEIDDEVQSLVDTALKPLHPPAGWKRKPEDVPDDLLVEHITDALVNYCHDCGIDGITASHNCLGKPNKSHVVKQIAKVTIYYRKEPFNLASPTQLLAYCHSKKYKIETTDKETLTKLVAKTGDKVLKLAVERRQVSKVEGTYVRGALVRMDIDQRLHPTFLHKPSTWRLSCTNPNLQNVAAGRDGRELSSDLAMEFRQCLEATPGCVLIEADFSGIEALLVGWFAGDPNYIKMARLGVHAFVAAHVIGKPPDTKLNDEALGKYLKNIKKAHPVIYDASKRVVHGSNYAMTPYGMRANYPDIFKTVADAGKIQNIYWKIAPKVQRWQSNLQDMANKQGFLGGPGQHPFALKHWFWNVYQNTNYSGQWKQSLGHDAKRCVAFYPQSTAACIIFETMLRLFCPETATENYIGDAYYGKTPLRAQIHDSLLLEVPEDQAKDVVRKLVTEMRRPIPQLPCPKEWEIGSNLSIGVEVKQGKNWAPRIEDEKTKEIWNPDGMQVIEPDMGVAADIIINESEEDDE